jgi:signal transduction histidine kinase
MTLTYRLSLFFLGALGLVVIGFSIALYLMADSYLYREVDDRLDATLNTLAAAAQIEPFYVEWNPSDRNIEGTEPVRWMVHDGSLWTVAKSTNLENDDLLANTDSPLTGSIPFPPTVVFRQGQPWQLRQRIVQCRERTEGMSAEEMAALAERIKTENPPLPGRRRSTMLLFTASLPLEPVQATLRQLVWALTGLSAGIMLLAAIGGRWFSRRALLPVTRMAQTVRTISADKLEQRLPVAYSGDEIADLGKSFNDLLSRLQESFERQRRFAGDASHQLRTPLTAILGQIEVALRRERPLEDYRQVLTTISGQALQMRQIVETLLFLARANAEARLPTLVELSWSAWLRKHVANWNGQERAPDLRLHCPSDDTLVVMAQAPLLGQLVDNLWENACKYSEPGQPIMLRLTGEPDYAVLIIEDKGCGIAAEDLPHVFEPFFRASHVKNRGIGGIGLGLSIAQRIATAFGGSISVESNLGEGTRFIIRLPRPSKAEKTTRGTAADGAPNGQATAIQAAATRK